MVNIDEYIQETNDKFIALANLEEKVNTRETTYLNQNANISNVNDLISKYEEEENIYEKEKGNIEKRLHTSNRKLYYENEETKTIIFYNLIFEKIFWFFYVVLIGIIIYKEKYFDIVNIISLIAVVIIFFFGRDLFIALLQFISAIGNYFNFAYYNL